MNAELVKASLALLPVGVLLFASSIALYHRKTIWSFVQLFGAACLTMVVLTHICEALGLLPSMGWGLEHSIGHYLDLESAIFGVILFPSGYLLNRRVSSK